MQEPVKPKRVRPKKIQSFNDPFQRVDPKLLEKMHRKALKLRAQDALL